MQCVLWGQVDLVIAACCVSLCVKMMSSSTDVIVLDCDEVEAPAANKQVVKLR